MGELKEIAEYLVCGDGKTYGYRETYAEALTLAAECKDAEIYAATWGRSGVPGLLQKFWVKVESEHCLNKECPYWCSGPCSAACWCGGYKEETDE